MFANKICCKANRKCYKGTKYVCEQNLVQIKQKMLQGDQKMFANENCFKLNRKLCKKDKRNSAEYELSLPCTT